MRKKSRRLFKTVGFLTALSFATEACALAPPSQFQANPTVFRQALEKTALLKTVPRVGGPTRTKTEIVSHFGRYEILREIASGGMGTVYLARQIGLKRNVALKVIKQEDASPQMIERFYREARAAAKLTHPGIVAIHDVGELDGQPYYTMDFVEGKSLRELFEETLASKKEFPIREALEIVSQVAQALNYAHRQGVVHRDIKPENILINKEGKPLVMDFGLAKDLAEETRLTVSGNIMGTPSYMSPEQARGLSSLDHRTDIYSLGVVLYELVTGELPFKAASGEMLRLLGDIAEKDPVKPGQRRRVHRDVETIILKAMEKDPTRRYETAATFALDIQQYLAGEPIQARPASLLYRAQRRLGRHRVWISVVSGIAVMASVGIGWFFHQSNVAAERAVAERARADAEQRRAAEEERRQREARANEHNSRGNDLSTKMQWQGAIEEYQKAIEINPRHSVAISNLAYVYYRTGDFERALEFASRAIEMSPTYAWAYGMRGTIYRDLGQHDAALRDLNEAVRLSPDDPLVLVDRATVFLAMNRYESAVQDARRALSLDSENRSREHWRAHGVIGDAYQQQNQLDQALEEYDAALRLNPDQYEVITHRARVYVLKGMLPVAREELQRALRIYPDHQGARTLLDYVEEQLRSGGDPEKKEPDKKPRDEKDRGQSQDADGDWLAASLGRIAPSAEWDFWTSLSELAASN